MPLGVPVIMIAQAGDSDLAVIRGIAAGQRVGLAPGLLAAVQQRCARARRQLLEGQPVYGVNTGMGALHHIRLSGEQQRAHQRNLLLARATGGPPWLDAAEVRAIMAVRLVTFLPGDAAVSAALCERLAELLNRGVVAAVPRGGMGSAGEIMQLAHAFGPLAGLGQVLGSGGALRSAPEALRGAGLTEFGLGLKEGIALIQGVPGTTGLCVLRLAEAASLIDLMEAASALSIAAAGASRDPYTAATARGDAVLAAVHERIRARAGTGGPLVRCRHRCRSGWPARCWLSCTGRLAGWKRPSSAR